MFLFGHLGFASAPATPSLDKGRMTREDLRWLLAGSLLPDLVDKTIGQFLFKPRYENGRIYCHTVLLASLLAAYGSTRRRERGDGKYYYLSLGVISHLILDKIWMDPETAFWPLLGHFLREPTSMGLFEQLLTVMKDPFFWLSEAGGALLLLRSLHSLGFKDAQGLLRFVLSGKTPSLSPAGDPNYNS
jgi:inner membrane protein